MRIGAGLAIGALAAVAALGAARISPARDGRASAGPGQAARAGLPATTGAPGAVPAAGHLGAEGLDAAIGAPAGLPGPWAAASGADIPPPPGGDPGIRLTPGAYRFPRGAEAQDMSRAVHRDGLVLIPRAGRFAGVPAH